MKNLLLFVFMWAALTGCKTRKPAEEAAQTNFIEEMKKNQSAMERSFIAEHDLFIKLYDRSKQKDEIPYPQLHILIDSIQDFRNMHGLLVDYIVGENEKLDSPTLGKEGKEIVNKRIADAKADADKVVGAYSAITQQIANLKMIYQISQIESRDWLREQHFRVNALQEQINEQSNYLKSEAVRLGLNFEDPKSSEINPETERYAELAGAHGFCLTRMALLYQELAKVELVLGETTLYEGPFIEKPIAIIEYEKAYLQAVNMMKEFVYLRQ